MDIKEINKVLAERQALLFRLWEERYGDPRYAHPYDLDELERRQTQAKLEQAGELSYHDPIEDDAAYKYTIEQAEKDTEKELKDIPKGRGYCHLFWQVKRYNLQSRYGIVWFPKSAMNPRVYFD